MSAGMWRELEEIADQFPALSQEAEATRDLALGCNAPRTSERYLGVFRKFVEFCRGAGLPRDAYFPASPAVVALFVQRLSARGLRPATVRVSLAALAWVHVVSGHVNPCTDATLRLVADGASRANAGPTRHATPIHPSDLRRVLEFLAWRGTPRSFQLASMMSIAFAAFLRIEELLALRWSDVTVGVGDPPAALLVFVGKRKNDQQREGVTRPVPADTATPTATWQLMRRYARAVRHPFPAGDDETLWPLIAEDGSVDYSVVLPRTAAYRALRFAFDAVGLRGDEYGWHCFRAGAATSAADRGVPEEVLMAAGGWKSTSAVRSYVHYSEATLVDVAATALDPDSAPAAVPRSRTPVSAATTSGRGAAAAVRSTRPVATTDRSAPRTLTVTPPRRPASGYRARVNGDELVIKPPSTRR